MVWDSGREARMGLFGWMKGKAVWAWRPLRSYLLGAW
jgi:hypothetical protein